MKAIYQKPTIDILLVNAQDIMVASLDNGETPSSINLNDATSTDDLPDGWSPSSRRGSLWDDDEE